MLSSSTPPKRGTNYPFSTDDRRLIARVRERLRWIDTLSEPSRSLAIAGVAEEEWPTYIAWISEARGLMDGTLTRVWRKDHWATEKAR